MDQNMSLQNEPLSKALQNLVNCAKTKKKERTREQKNLYEQIG